MYAEFIAVFSNKAVECREEHLSCRIISHIKDTDE